jgi:hypothetical protein
MNMRMYQGALALTLALGGAGLAAADSFRCQLSDNVVSYQERPCALPDLSRPEPASPGRTVAAPRPPAPVAPRAPQAIPAATSLPQATPDGDEPYARLTRRKREVLDLTARLERCRADQPEFAARSADLHQAWRRRHEATLAEYGHLLALKVRAARRSDAGLCNEEWLRELEPLARTPDPRFSTVEKTWDLFVGALQRADRAMILNCVTGPAARRLKDRLEKLADADLRRMSLRMRGMKVQWGDDYEKEGLVVQDDRVAGIAFRNVNEEWKIGELGTASGPAATPKRSSPDS